MNKLTEQELKESLVKIQKDLKELLIRARGKPEDEIEDNDDTVYDSNMVYENDVSKKRWKLFLFYYVTEWHESLYQFLDLEAEVIETKPCNCSLLEKLSPIKQS